MNEDPNIVKTHMGLKEGYVRWMTMYYDDGHSTHFDMCGPEGITIEDYKKGKKHIERDPDYPGWEDGVYVSMGNGAWEITDIWDGITPRKGLQPGRAPEGVICHD